MVLAFSEMDGTGNLVPFSLHVVIIHPAIAWYVLQA